MANTLEYHSICPNRGMLVALKVAALMARNMPAAERAEIEPQLHDILDLELSYNPSFA